MEVDPQKDNKLMLYGILLVTVLLITHLTRTLTGEKTFSTTLELASFVVASLLIGALFVHLIRNEHRWFIYLLIIGQIIGIMKGIVAYQEMYVFSLNIFFRVALVGVCVRILSLIEGKKINLPFF